MRAILPLLLLAACMQDSETDKATLDAESGAFDTASLASELRVDVSPPSTSDLLPQSHVLPGPGEGYDVELEPTVVWSGRVTGEVVRGWPGAAEVPTTEEPLVATVTASVTGSRLGGSVQSDAEGEFVLELPRYTDAPYDLTIVPHDADLAPFHWEARNFTGDDDSPIDIDSGIPVYGRVTDATGAGIPRVAMRIVRTDLELGEIASAYFETDSTGWYVARVEESGLYSVEVIGGPTGGASSRVVPTLRTDVVVDDPDAGAAVYVDLGTLEEALARGYVFDEAGDEVDGVKLRFTSQALDGADGALVVETETNEGLWFADLLPGRWDVEVIPPYDLLASPTSTTIDVGPGTTEVEDLYLEPAAQLTGNVRPPTDATSIAGTTIQAKQLFGDHYVYDGVVDQQGNFLIDVPGGDYLLTFAPPTESGAGAITYVQMTTGVERDVYLEAGEPFGGTITFDGEGVAFAVLRVYDAEGILVGRGITDESGGFGLLVPTPGFSGTDTGD